MFLKQVKYSWLQNKLKGKQEMLQVPLAPETRSRVEPVPPVPRRASPVKPGPYLQMTDSPR